MSLHQRLRSLTSFLPSFSPNPDYSQFVPLSSTDITGSPEDGLSNGSFMPKPPGRRISLVQWWQFSSPVVVVVLALLLIFKQRPYHDEGVLNPYACQDKALYGSLDQMCAADTTSRAGRQQVREATRARTFCVFWLMF